MGDTLRRPVKWRSGSMLLRGVLVLCSASVLWAPSCLSGVGSEITDPSSVTNYSANLSVGADGTMSSLETVEVDTGLERHGIFRVFDTSPRYRGGADHPVSDVEVTRDGAPEPWEEDVPGSASLTARIGDPDTILSTGPHTYTIASTTTDVLEPAADGTVVWWWDVVGPGWSMSMDHVDVTATLPAAPSKVECVVDVDTPCPAEVDGRNLRVQVDRLHQYTPVTVRVTFPQGAVPRPDGPVPSVDDPTGAVRVAAALSVLALAVVLLLLRRTREPEPGFPVLFEPPVGVPPALGARILDEHDAANGLQATLFDLAARGVLLVSEQAGTWTVTCMVDPGPFLLQPLELGVLTDLGLTVPGASFTLGRNAAAGQQVHHARRNLRAALRAEAPTFLRPTWAGAAVRWTAGAAVVLLLLQTAIYHVAGASARSVSLTLVTTVLSLGLVGAALDPRTRTVRTEPGRNLWSRVGGFARFLSTDSSDSRFDAAAHLDWYPAYLPWALALGVGKEWAHRFEVQGVDPSTAPVPWMAVTSPGTGWSAPPTQAFASALSSSIASYSSPSSGGGAFSGGGFSGGSGGGGGGGGSW